MLSTRQLKIDYGPTTRFGIGAIAELPGIVARLGHRFALVVTDPGVAASGIPDGIHHALQSAGIQMRVFGEVQANPSTDTLNRGAGIAREWEPAAVVALGGGS